MKVPLTLRIAFTRDADKRRLYWLYYRAPLNLAHREVLRPIVERLSDSAWASEAERSVIRVLFNLYRGTNVEVSR